jgi:hypothetical protein
MNELISILSVMPYGTEIMIVLGTLTAFMTVIAPVVNFIVQSTETKADDEFLKRMKANPVLRKVWQVGKLLKRFSLIR